MNRTMNRTWNLSAWSLAYGVVVVLTLLDLFDIIDMPWFIWWPVLAVAVAGALKSWGRKEDASRDGRSVPDSDKTL